MELLISVAFSTFNTFSFSPAGKAESLTEADFVLSSYFCPSISTVPDDVTFTRQKLTPLFISVAPVTLVTDTGSENNISASPASNVSS